MKTLIKLIPLFLLAACSHQQYKAPEGTPLSGLQIQTASKQLHQHEVLFSSIKLCQTESKISLGDLNTAEPIVVEIPSQQPFAFIINSQANLKLTQYSEKQALGCSASLEFTPIKGHQYYARHWVSQDAKECTIRLFDQKGKILPSQPIGQQNCIAQK